MAKKFKTKKRKAEFSMPMANNMFTKQTMGPDGKMTEGINGAGIASAGIGMVSSMIPSGVNKPGGVSDKGMKISGGIQKGLDGAAGIANSIPGGQVFGAALSGVSLLTKLGTLFADIYKSNHASALADQTFNPVNQNAVGGTSFGSRKYGGYKAAYGAPVNPNQVVNINGPSHENGGVNINNQVEAEGGEAMKHDYIYSNVTGYDASGKISISPSKVKTTFADAAKRIEKKYGKKMGDKIADDTKKFELDALTADSEAARLAKEQQMQSRTMKRFANDINQLQAKYGAKLPKADNGLPFPNFDTKDFQSFYNTQFVPNNAGSVAIDFGKNNSGFGVFGPQSTKAWGLAENAYREYKGSTAKINEPLFKGIVPQGRMDLNQYAREASAFKPSEFVGPLDNFTRGFPESGAEVQVPRSPGDRTFIPEMGLTTGDKLSLASGAPATLFNAAMAMRKPEQESSKMNPFQTEALGILKNLKPDFTNAYNKLNTSWNVQRDLIDNNSTSAGTKLANLQRSYATNIGATDDLAAKEQEMNLGLKSNYANALNTAGEANRQEAIRVSGVNAANRARREMFAAEAVNNIGDTMARTAAGMNQRELNQMLAKTLGTTDFKFAGMKSETIEKYTGQFSDLGTLDLSERIKKIQSTLTKDPNIDPSMVPKLAMYFALNTTKQKDVNTATADLESQVAKLKQTSKTKKTNGGN